MIIHQFIADFFFSHPWRKLHWFRNKLMLSFGNLPPQSPLWLTSFILRCRFVCGWGGSDGASDKRTSLTVISGTCRVLHTAWQIRCSVYMNWLKSCLKGWRWKCRESHCRVRQTFVNIYSYFEFKLRPIPKSLMSDEFRVHINRWLGDTVEFH